MNRTIAEKDFKLSKKAMARKDWRKNWQIYLLFLPLAVYFIIFNYIPMVGILVAFEDYSVTKGFFGSPWVGFANFRVLFTGDEFLIALRNTACMAVLNLALGFLPPIILALLFSECHLKPYRRFTQIVSYMPNFVSAVVVCALVTEFFGMSGAITKILTAIGFQEQNWLANTQIPVFWLIYAFIGIWMGAGFGSVIYTAIISSVSGDLKEAAALDGANRWQRIRYVVLPALLPLCMMNLTLSVGTMFLAGWDKVLLLYMPKTYDVSDVLYTYTYRMAFGNSVNFGLSTASGLFQSIIGTTLLIVSNKINKKLTSYGLF
ncbi:MAG: ABC transporter permease subunit [Acetatifactor sp.]|nr:ABC transporter permease subunit [Acetatifactor sp.]